MEPAGNTRLPPPPAPETADIETSSDAYAARFGGATGAWMLSVQERLTLALLADLPAATVLDVGGGHGQLARPLFHRGYRVTVLGSADRCRERISDLVAAGACAFQTGNVIALPYPDGAFEVALSFRLLPHCVAWPALIGELCRVARQRVVVDYPTGESLNAVAPALFGAKRKLEGNTRPWRLFRHAEIEAAFAAHGFEPVRRAPQFFLPMALHRALKCRPLSEGLESLCVAAGLTRRWGSPVIVAMGRRKPDPGARPGNPEQQGRS